MPPGGRGVVGSGVEISARITDEPIANDAFTDAPAPSDGAVLLFLGVVRDHNEGRPVRGLRYEAYREMAEPVLERIAREAAEGRELGELRVVHRTGGLAVGETSVAVRVSGPHRDACYAASRQVIEEIKKRLPVWKEERYADGGAEWLEGRDPREAADPAGTES